MTDCRHLDDDKCLLTGARHPECVGCKFQVDPFPCYNSSTGRCPAAGNLMRCQKTDCP